MVALAVFTAIALDVIWVKIKISKKKALQYGIRASYFI